MILIDGKKVSADIRLRIKEEVDQIKADGKQIGLAVIIVGEDPASKVYVKNKINACKETGICSYHFELPETSTTEEVIALIHKLNIDDAIHGILVQLPLPKHLDKYKILAEIDVTKDVDGFSAYQLGKTFLGGTSLESCTPKGIIALLKAYSIPISGKNAVMVGRSNIVGKPMAVLLLKEDATVTICHTKTVDCPSITRNADIIVVAVGKPKFLTEDMVKEGAVVIDTGINRVDGKLCGDVDFEHVAPKCSYITPVPGGVGPMTVTMLLQNTIEAYKAYHVR